jgi:hypothetical protein
MESEYAAVLAVLLAGAILAAGCTTPYSPANSPAAVSNTIAPAISPDQAALDKMQTMVMHLEPIMKNYSAAMVSNDYATARSSAVEMQDYIRLNLPEMRQLANGTTIDRAAAQEYVASLEDWQTAMNQSVQGVDDYNSGDYAGAMALFNSTSQDIQSAARHVENTNADLQPQTGQ